MILLISGILAFSFFTVNILHWIFLNTYKVKFSPKDYGLNSWAVITGASDGLGKGFAHVLAKYKFKICLVARNLEKLETVKKSILEKYPNTEIKCVVADFKESLKDGFYEKIQEQLKSLNISMLINNVGVASLSYFHETPEDVVDDLLTVNIFPQTLLTRKLIHQLLSRTKDNKFKSAVINVSSMAGTKPIPYDTLYSATKALNDFFSRALSIEFRQKIDFISLRPFWVSTPMAFDRKPGFDTITPKECAEGCLKDLGNKNYTWGHFKHEAQGILFHWLPEWTVLFVLRFVGPLMAKEREMNEREYLLKRKIQS